MKLKNCNAEQFITNLNGRKVVCFGAGHKMANIERTANRIEHLEDHIAFFVDNDRKKQGTRLDYLGHDFVIKSADELKTVSPKDYVCLITCTFFIDIYEELKNMPELRDMECYMYDMVCSHPGLDLEEFITREIEKGLLKNWKESLAELRLKDRHEGKRCFLIGNGPSLTVEDLELLKGEITFAANRIYMLFDRTDWRPTYYFCVDYERYRDDHKMVDKIEADTKFVPVENAMAAGAIYERIAYYNRVVSCVTDKEGKSGSDKYPPFSENAEEVVYDGRTVLYDAIQWAVYMGFTELYLLGADNAYRFETLEDGTVVENDVKRDHFDENYSDGHTLPAPIYAAHLAFEKAKKVCERKGIIIKNATRGGRLEVFERISLEELIC